MTAATFNSDFFQQQTNTEPAGFTTIGDIPVGQHFELGPGHEDSGDRFQKVADDVCMVSRWLGSPQSHYTDESGKVWEGPSGWEAVPCR